MQLGSTNSIFDGIAIHSENVPFLMTIKTQDVHFDDENKHNHNYTILMAMTYRQRMGWPYGQCRTYGQTYDKSYVHCYRQCIQSQYRHHFQCIPLFIDNIVSQLDFTSNDTQFCDQMTLNSTVNDIRDKYYTYCSSYCPKPCLEISYSFKSMKSVTQFGNKKWFEMNMYPTRLLPTPGHAHTATV